MVLKTIFGFAAWIATWLWLMSGRWSPLQLIAVYVIHGFAQLFISFNVAHDANHGGYSGSARLNRVLAYTFDLVGVSSYMWRLLHNTSHHSFINIREADTTLISGRIFRFTPHDVRLPFHRYQHLYAPALYCLSTLDWVMTKD
jgi:linoleoyl-CoA desaturase